MMTVTRQKLEKAAVQAIAGIQDELPDNIPNNATFKIEMKDGDINVVYGEPTENFKLEISTNTYKVFNELDKRQKILSELQDAQGKEKTEREKSHVKKDKPAGNPTLGDNDAAETVLDAVKNR